MGYVYYKNLSFTFEYLLYYLISRKVSLKLEKIEIKLAIVGELGIGKRN